ncbi:MAG TPA: AsmA family protein, partial [Blastocatellia bacterium]|nr:AsmA family protein [Blastocatellia bacterium]
IPSLFNINTYRQQIADQIEQRLGRQIVLGSLSLSLLPTVKISARDVSISDDPKFAQGAFIKAQSAAFKVRFGSLLRGNPEVSSIELNSPEVTLIREKTGEWNWKTLKPLQPAGQGLAIGSMGVAVHRGRLTLIDRRQPIAAESNSPIDLEVSGLNLNFDQAAVTASPFRITLGKQVVVEVAKLSLLNHGQQRVQLEAELQNAPLNELIDLAGSFGIHSGFTGTGVVRLKATIDADLAKPDAATVIVVQGVLSEAQLQIPRLKQPLAVASAEISIKSDSLRLENLKAQLGSSHITGWTQLQKLSQIVANFDLQLDQLNVNELQQLVAENEVPSSKPGKPQTSLPSPFIADGKLTVGRVMLDKFEVTNLQSQVNFKEQVIDLNVLNARFCGGQYQGQVRINQTQSNSGIDLNGRFGGVNVNQFLSAVSSSKSDVYGQASGTLNVHSR